MEPLCPHPHTQTTPTKKAYERYQGHLMGPPTDPGPWGGARVLKWSVLPWSWRRAWEEVTQEQESRRYYK
ncbi:unnamed protein product [Staurois parvus]|uniref:Uncharacterized protein n=1 Tax=Staurois parvus TaxID=386267 RepID=A0ABN9E3U0_9NEOB|nr:unnamed protein product [Staurois parvus]